MKITLPAVEREIVGTRFSYAGSETVYFAGERPSKGNFKPVTTPVYENRLTSKVAFDYDFKLKTRLLGGAYFGLTVVLFPVGVTIGLGAFVYSAVRDVITAVSKRARVFAGATGDFAEIVYWEARSALRDIINP